MQLLPWQCGSVSDGSTRRICKLIVILFGVAVVVVVAGGGGGCGCCCWWWWWWLLLLLLLVVVVVVVVVVAGGGGGCCCCWWWWWWWSSSSSFLFPFFLLGTLVHLLDQIYELAAYERINASIKKTTWAAHVSIMQAKTSPKLPQSKTHFPTFPPSGGFVSCFFGACYVLEEWK